MVNRMKEFEILMGADGPNHDVIKIKPPLTFTKENTVFCLINKLQL
jgi:4-aminobutyrate aminotransferase-like enzyme